MCSSRLRHPFWIWSDRRAACFCRKLLQTSLGFFAINKSCHPLQSMYKRLQEYHRVETGTSGLRLFTERLASRFCCLTSDPFPVGSSVPILGKIAWHGAPLTGTTGTTKKVCLTFWRSYQNPRSIIKIYQLINLPVVPHKAVAEVSKIGNL